MQNLKAQHFGPESHVGGDRIDKGTGSCTICSVRRHVSSAFSFKRSGQKGVSIIEILVAVVILAVGLLGLARMQATGLIAAHSAYMRSQATSLVYDMSDRMRVNRQAALANAYAIGLDDPLPNATGTLAQNDVRQWRQTIEATLPNGSGSIERDNNLLRITIRWTDERDANNEQLFVMETEI